LKVKTIKIHEVEAYIKKICPIIESNNALIQSDIDVANQRMQTMFDYLQLSVDVANTVGRVFEQQKQKELSMAGDNAREREKIEREYQVKQKAAAISSAIIQNAINVLKAYGTFPVPNIPLAAITGALGIAEIGLISAQKFAEGGYTGDGLNRDSTGEKVAGVVHEKEYVIPKEPTRKYRALLEAIHADNPMAIAEELKNRQFHMVWGGVQPRLSEAHRQDPFTQKMYELMKNSVTTYQDTNGDTVLRFADGSTRIVRAKA
jgi:hypothetical protein